MKKITTLFFVLVLSASLFAGGFQINEHGARPLGMGGAFTAVVNDASAIYWNGAGLVDIAGTNFVLGTALIAPSSTFQIAKTFPASFIGNNYSEAKTVSQQFFPSHFFAAHKFGNDFAVGLGFTTPYGLGVKWDPTWQGGLLAINTSLQIYSINAVVAYRLIPQLSLSAGLSYNFGDVTIEKKQIYNPSNLATTIVTMDGSDKSAIGYSFGLMYKPTERFSAGVAFRSQVKYNFEGTVKSNPSIPLLTSDITADLTTPANVVAGVAYKFMPELLVSADFQYVGWSSYDSLAIDFSNGLHTSSPREYKDSWIARLGGEYNFSNAFALRLGFYFDKNPVPSDRINPTLPEGDRLGISAGVGYQFTQNLGADLSFLYISATELTVDKSKERLISSVASTEWVGTYNSSASIVGLSIHYGF